MKAMENRLARLEQSMGAELVVLQVVEEGHGMSDEEMDAAVAR